MLEDARGINHLVARIIVEELYRLDVVHYAVAPGGRSLPLVTAINEHEKASINLFNDERSAAFWAQGFAKRSNKAVVLVVTSGTAVANLLPGFIEAEKSSIPLIAITCDRPWELHHACANQTINQKNVFSEYSKFSMDLPAAENKIFPRSLLANLDQLVNTAHQAPAGPVHLNIAFRKPFFSDEKCQESEQEIIEDWFYSKEVFTKFTYPQISGFDDFEKLVGLIEGSKNPLIIAGPLKANENKKAITALASKLAVPILADINSSLRGEENVFSLYNSYLDQLSNADLILYFGGRILSDKLKDYLNQHNCPKVLVNDYAKRQDAIENDFLSFDWQICQRPGKLAAALEYKLKAAKAGALLEECKNQEKRISEGLAAEFVPTSGFTEPAAIYHLVKNLSEDAIVYSSPSLLIRELEKYAEPKSGTEFYANRGVVGIDGVISSALGFAQASGKKTYLLIGDQAFMHDLSALSKVVGSNLQIFLVNNAGGGIFRLVDANSVEDLLVNRQEVSYADLVKGFNLNYAQVQDFKSLKERVQYTYNAEMATVTEIAV